MRRAWLAGALSLAVLGNGPAVRAQEAAARRAFEVASIKVHTDGRSGDFPSPGRIWIGNRTLKQLIAGRYHLMNYQVLGATGWMDTIAYDIDAKAAGRADYGELGEMVKTLLAERFHLIFHMETREAPTYWLLVARGGPKMKPADTNDQTRGGISNHSRFIQGWKTSVPMLVSFLGAELDKPLLDKTELDGKYDFKLEWADDVQPSDGVAPAELQKPSLFAAVQEQLGLKLEVHPGPVEFLVIDHAEKPGAN